MSVGRHLSDATVGKLVWSSARRCAQPSQVSAIESAEPGKMKAAAITSSPTSPSHAPAASKLRLTDIDRAKGLAIILVVFGHLVPHGTLPQGQEWYDVLWVAIYRFHMPF